MSEKFVTLIINTNQNDGPFEIGATKIENGIIIEPSRKTPSWIAENMSLTYAEERGIKAVTK